MTRIELLRYYGHGKHYEPKGAQAALEKLQKKHPDREYAIMVNMRSGYSRFQIMQIDKLVLDWPDPEDLGLPAKEPERGDFSSYEDFAYEQAKRRNIINSAIEPLKATIRKKLNP